jgi:restriction system protein
MSKKWVQEITNVLDKFERSHSELTERAVTKAVQAIFTPLLEHDGFHRDRDSMRRHDYLHYIASKGKRKDRKTIGVVFKQDKAIAKKDEVEELVAGCTIDGIDSVIFVSTSPIDQGAEIYNKELYPVEFQKFSFQSIKNWITKLAENLDESEVTRILRNCTQKIIEIVLKNPDALEELEWRDIERMVAELFRGLGFEVELTASSKDGGKDIILEFRKKGMHHSYIVEIKHWRSNQKVKKPAIVHFVKIIAKEKRTGGLFLSTYGFAENAIESLTIVERKKVRFANKDKIVSLCDTYVRRNSGLWLKDLDFEKVLLEKTF